MRFLNFATVTPISYVLGATVLGSRTAKGLGKRATPSGRTRAVTSRLVDRTLQHVNVIVQGLGPVACKDR